MPELESRARVPAGSDCRYTRSPSRKKPGGKRRSARVELDRSKPFARPPRDGESPARAAARHVKVEGSSAKCSRTEDEIVKAIVDSFHRPRTGRMLTLE